MSDLALVARNPAADQWHQRGGNGAALLGRGRRDASAAERGLPFICLKPVGRLLDDAQSGLIGRLRCLAPSEETMTAEHHADIFGMSPRHIAKLEPEVEARS